jgi:hypothetical protein
MKVAVPLLQHSQWFGHLALSQTVWSLSSSRSVRVREKVSDVGNGVRSHSGNRGLKGFGSAVVISELIYLIAAELKDEDGGGVCLQKEQVCIQKHSVCAGARR